MTHCQVPRFLTCPRTVRLYASEVLLVFLHEFITALLRKESELRRCPSRLVREGDPVLLVAILTLEGWQSARLSPLTLEDGLELALDDLRPIG